MQRGREAARLSRDLLLRAGRGEVFGRDYAVVVGGFGKRLNAILGRSRFGSNV
jgi:hypothetical protein